MGKEKFLILGIYLSKSNFQCTLTDINGNIINWCSPRRLKYSNRAKTSHLAIYETLYFFIEKFFMNNSNFNLIVRFKGNNIELKGQILEVFQDLLPKFNPQRILIETRFFLAFNGCRPKKRRKL